ncbi:MAG: FAD:protein FMN transferase, partial [Planctomycetota bacterium]|nr:FAD:protein FMN transferase [Planctomycetota bacterium]
EISLRPGVRFDFGAVGKGFALSEAASELSEWQLPSYMIQFGGEIAIGEPPPGRVGWRVQVPGWPEVLELASCAVATSGSSEQYVEIDGVRYAHVLDARTGMPLTEQREVTVISHSSLRADATATCIHILGPDRAQEMLDQNAVSIGIIVKDGAVVWQSPTWPRPYHRGE